jgi:hypothetical protein
LTIKTTPDDHFAAGPHCGVSISGAGCSARACTPPGIVACALSLQQARYYWKGITTELWSTCFTRIAYSGHCRAGVLGRQCRLKQMLRKYWASQALCYNKRIVPERIEKFTQHFRLSGVFCHAIHLTL